MADVERLRDDHYALTSNGLRVEAIECHRIRNGIEAQVKVSADGHTVWLDTIKLAKAPDRQRFLADLRQRDRELDERVLMLLHAAADQCLPRCRDDAPRDAESGPNAQGEAIVYRDPEPWPEPVDLGAVLTEIRSTLTRFVVLPDGAADAVALWIAHTYLMGAWTVSPFLLVNSPIKQCGKTTLLRVLQRLVWRPQTTSSITEASLYRLIAKNAPTLILDEAENCINDKDSPLYGVLNAGHTVETAKVIRTVGDDHEPRMFSTWAPKIVALIGTLKDTAMDRSVVIPMRRRRASESVARLRMKQLDQLERACRPLRQQLTRFAIDAEDQCRAMDEDDLAIPSTLRDRDQDNWFPLFALAKLAGDSWLEVARTAAQTLTGAESGEDSAGLRLLRDCFEIRERLAGDSIKSERLKDELNAIDHWHDSSHGRGVNATFIAKKLHPFDVRPAGTLRFPDGTTAKGYRWASFHDAWSRYLKLHPSQGNKPNESGPETAKSDPSHGEFVTDAKNAISSIKTGLCYGVTDAPPEEGTNSRQSSDRGAVRPRSEAFDL